MTEQLTVEEMRLIRGLILGWRVAKETPWTVFKTLAEKLQTIIYRAEFEAVSEFREDAEREA